MAGNIADSLALLTQAIFKDHEIPHVFLDHPWDYAARASDATMQSAAPLQQLGMAAMGKYFGAAYTALTDKQFGILRMTNDGKLMVDASVNVVMAGVDIDAVAPGSHSDSIVNFGSTNPAAYDKLANQNVVPMKVEADGTVNVKITNPTAFAPVVWSKRCYHTYTVTDVDSTVTIAHPNPGGVAFSPDELDIINDSTVDNVYVNYGAVALANATCQKIKPFENFHDEFKPASVVHFICEAGKTAVIRISARAL